MVDAQWLFENHRSHLSMKKYIQARISHILQPESISNADEILSQALRMPVLGMPIQNNTQGSSTERIAINLSIDNDNGTNAVIEDYKRMLELYSFLLELYEAAVAMLTSRELWLINAIYNEGLTISEICEMRDSPFGICDRSTIFRNRKRIISKVNQFLQAYIPKEVSQCHMEKCIEELKKLQEKSIMN